LILTDYISKMKEGRQFYNTTKRKSEKENIDIIATPIIDKESQKDLDSTKFKLNEKNLIYKCPNSIKSQKSKIKRDR